jgi:hypothetical protein
MRSIIREQKKWQALKRSSRRLRMKYVKSDLDLSENPFCEDRQRTDRRHLLRANSNPRLLQRLERKGNNTGGARGGAALLKNAEAMYSRGASQRKAPPWALGSRAREGPAGRRAGRRRRRSTVRTKLAGGSPAGGGGAGGGGAPTFGHRPMSAARLYDPLTDSVLRRPAPKLSVDALMGPEELAKLLLPTPRGVEARLKAERERGWSPEQLLNATRSLVGKGSGAPSPFSVGLGDRARLGALDGPKFQTSALRKAETGRQARAGRAAARRASAPGAPRRGSRRHAAGFRHGRDGKPANGRPLGGDRSGDGSDDDAARRSLETGWNGSVYRPPEESCRTRPRRTVKPARTTRQKLRRFRRLERSPFRADASASDRAKLAEQKLVYELTSSTILTAAEVKQTLREHARARARGGDGPRSDPGSARGSRGRMGGRRAIDGYAGVEAARPPASIPGGVPHSSALLSRPATGAGSVEGVDADAADAAAARDVREQLSRSGSGRAGSGRSGSAPRSRGGSAPRSAPRSRNGSAPRSAPRSAGGFVSRTGKAPTLPGSAPGVKL